MEGNDTDTYFMNLALKVARKALSDGEVPVGCVVTMPVDVVQRCRAARINPLPHTDRSTSGSPCTTEYNTVLKESDLTALRHTDTKVTLAPTESVVVSHGANQVNACRDATRHAEIVAMDRMLTMSTSTDQLRLPSVWNDSWDQYDASDTGYGWQHHTCGAAVADLQHCTVYVTCEPCIMCAAALASVRVCRVVYGCANDKFGGCGSIVSLHAPTRPTGSSTNASDTSDLATNTNDASLSTGFAVTSGILKDEAIQLLRSFYQGENHHAPKDKRRRKQAHET